MSIYSRYKHEVLHGVLVTSLTEVPFIVEGGSSSPCSVVS